ncbi:hypothetical protein [Planktothricoides raciborskii]|uniref:Uncharacterized protein n=1 Tax=Planktothricoides raciborskii FACHB-1370 TaxID=2949576 RepID=A0ABR8EBQ3_9CYAN|nr:hypothetical protein [Planktothricoides raciborskii]MBD2544188.1 hypothetical protein [Planktothricoides raciborskii FACHB-1370]MBD2583916.1 hypothetical protein [Planktothricoides raciborskii FACHB-1261]
MNRSISDFTELANELVHVFSRSDTQSRAMSDAAYAKATSYTWADATELFEKALYTAIERSKKDGFSVVTPPLSSSR